MPPSEPDHQASLVASRTAVPACFPTPALALRTTCTTQLTRVRDFARHQATAAEALRARLVDELPRHQLPGRLALLRQAFADLIQWRYDLALRASGRPGIGAVKDPGRFRRPLRDEWPNCDRLGYTGRFRAGANWDASTRTYRGGRPTPASVIIEAYGQAARDRFAAEAGPHDDTLLTMVAVPGGGLIPGNSLVRGAEAERIAAKLTARVSARGHDTSQFETGLDPIYAVSAYPHDADALHGIAMVRLAGAGDLPRAERIPEWQLARYLLYQAPQTKKGSDAVTRVFLVGVGAALFGVAPVLEQDCDLRCLVLRQRDATVMPADAMLWSAVRG